MQVLAHQGFTVVTGAQVSTVLGLDRQRQLLGCSKTECMTELAQALGVEAVVSGSVARLGAKLRVSVKAFSAQNGNVLGSYAETAADRAEVVSVLSRAVASFSSAAEEVAEAPYAPLVAPLVAGLLGAAVGAGCLIGAHVVSANMDTTAQSPRENPIPLLQAQAATGQALQSVGVALLAVGGAVAVGSLIWGAVVRGPGAEGAQVSLFTDGRASALVVSGVW